MTETQNPETPAAAPAASSWDFMPPELRSHAEAKGWTKAADPQAALLEAVKAHQAAEKHIGAPADKILRLPDQMGDEWWSKNAAAFGVPAAPDGYEIARPDLPEGLPWDENFEAAARAAFHEAKAPPHIVNAAVKLYAEQARAAFEADQKALHGAQESMMKDLEGSWGASVKANTETAKSAFQHFARAAGVEGPGAEGMAARISQVMGGDAAMLKMFHAIGAAMGEDRLKGGGLGSGATLVGAADIQSEIDSIRQSPAYRQNASAFSAKMDGLYRALAIAQQRGV